MNTPFRNPRTTPIALALIGFLLPLIAANCSRSSSSSDTTPDLPKRLAVATVYPLSDIVQQVAGTAFDVKWLCENGQDPRDLKLSPEQKLLAHRADLIVTSGFREPWAGENLDDNERASRLFLLDATYTGRTVMFEHAALWLDFQIVKELAEDIRERATVWDTKHETLYRANADVVIKSLDDLDADYRRRLAPFNGRAFVSLRPLWGQLAGRYGLREIAPVNATPQSLTDADVRILKEAAKEANTDLLAVDPTLLPGIQRELQLRTNLRLLPLDPLGSSAPDGRSSYLKLMQYNLDQLENGLK